MAVLIGSPQDSFLHDVMAMLVGRTTRIEKGYTAVTAARFLHDGQARRRNNAGMPTYIVYYPLSSL